MVGAQTRTGERSLILEAVVKLPEVCARQGKVMSIVWPVVESVKHHEDAVELELLIPSNLLYFKGHFDQAPVLPGVVQIHWAIEFGRQYFRLPETFTGLEVIKFQDLIIPQAQIKLTLHHPRHSNKLSFSYTSFRGRHSSGRIVMK
jgi:3-hydroxymyristoyl/3-hydroxydecanoyl-(acyl carrier protein) dehydratase